MNIALIGCGAYSLSMAKRLSKKQENNIKIWCEDDKKIKEFNETNKIKSIFKDEKFNKNIIISNSYKEVMENSDVIFIMTASKFIAPTLESMKEFYNKKTPIVIGTKGLELNSKEYTSKLVKKILKTNNISVIAGPSFATDILNNEILALTVATKKSKIFKLLKELYKDLNAILVRSNDLEGVMLCSTIKNIYAIGNGILNGLGLPNSNQAIYLTKVINEMLNILYEMNCYDTTLLTLAGFGDTLMTCSDEKSRNYTYGTKLTAKTKTTAKNYLNKTTVEGHEALPVIVEKLKAKKIKAPLIFRIYEIVYENKDVKTLKEELFN